MEEQEKQAESAIKQTGKEFASKVEDQAKKKLMKKIIATLGVKGVLITILVIAATSLLTVIFLAACIYLDNIDTKAKAETAKENAIGTEALDTILEYDDDKYKITYDGKTGKEAIEAILADNEMNFEDFSEEEIEVLYKCLKVEWATTYPNLGADVDNKDINSEYVQGVITIKREKYGEPAQILEYKPYDEFTNIKDESALNYFSLKDGKLVIPTWNSSNVSYKIEGTNIPDGIASLYQNSGEQLFISEALIDYRKTIGIHTIPFEILLSLLINTEDVNFVSELADVALDSTIELTVFDNVTVITNVETEHTHEDITYNKWVDYTITTTVKELDESKDIPPKTISTSSQKYYDEKIDSTETQEIDYTITTTRVNTSSSFVLDMTYVSSWLADVKNNYTYCPPDPDKEPTILDLGDPYVYHEESEIEAYDFSGDSDVENFRRSKGSTSTRRNEAKKTTIITEIICKIDEARKQKITDGLNELTKNTSKTDKYEYIKTTKESLNIGKKFKEVYDNNEKAQAQLAIVDSWLFELLEETESGVDYVSIMKYLLYICTGNDYGVTEEDILDIFNNKEFDYSYTLGGGLNQVVQYKGKTITYSPAFATETKTPQELGIEYQTVTGVQTTNYDACRVCNEYAEGTIPTTAIGLTLDKFPKVVAKWTSGSFVEYGDWVYINGWGYALVADCGGFTGKDSDYYHLDCFVGQDGDILDDGQGNYSALKRPCINAPGIYSREPGNRTNETIYVIKADVAEKLIQENYQTTASSESVEEMLNFGSKALGMNLSGAKNAGVISPNFSGYSGSWCSVYAFSLYEHAGFITLEEANRLASPKADLAYAAFWQLMDGSNHYNGYLANGVSYGNVNYLPKPGDLILYDFGGVNYASHVGVVYEVNGSTMRTIEGNTDSGICAIKERSYCTPRNKI